MTKIFRYELRRLLWNKVFAGILVVSLFYSWLMLTGTIILGVAHTAPFSPWSFGYYLSQILPMICLGELFFVTFFTSGPERRTAVITEATPVDRKAYTLVRCGAVLTATTLLILCVIAMGVGFYIRFFHWTAFSGFIAPALLTLVPAVLFCLGVGWCLGRVHPALVYVLMPVPILLSFLPLPQAADFSMGAFFAGYPLSLDMLDPAFSLPASVLCGRLLYAAVGLIVLAYSWQRGTQPALPQRRSGAAPSA